MKQLRSYFRPFFVLSVALAFTYVNISVLFPSSNDDSDLDDYFFQIDLDDKSKAGIHVSDISTIALTPTIGHTLQIFQAFLPLPIFNLSINSAFQSQDSCRSPPSSII